MATAMPIVSGVNGLPVGPSTCAPSAPSGRRAECRRSPRCRWPGVLDDPVVGRVGAFRHDDVADHRVARGPQPAIGHEGDHEPVPLRHRHAPRPSPGRRRHRRRYRRLKAVLVALLELYTLARQRRARAERLELADGDVARQAAPCRNWCRAGCARHRRASAPRRWTAATSSGVSTVFEATSMTPTRIVLVRQEAAISEIGTRELAHSSETCSIDDGVDRREDLLILPPFGAERLLPFEVGLDAVAVADVDGGRAFQARAPRVRARRCPSPSRRP